MSSVGGAVPGTSSQGTKPAPDASMSLPAMFEDIPLSSDDLQIPIKDLDALLSVYGTLRTFSFLFRLSPFPLKTLCHELKKNSMSGLVDEIAVQLLKTIRDFPPELEGDAPEEGAVKYTGDPDFAYMISGEINKLISDPVWRYLDIMTWPEFMRRLLSICNPSLGGQVTVCEWLSTKEWNLLPLSAKIASLHFLIELLFDSPVLRDMINGWDSQHRECFASEKLEISAKRAVMARLGKVKSGKVKSGAASDDSDDDAKTMSLPPEYDHLYARGDELVDLEQEHCELSLLSGKLVCCDGCPAAYKKESVGLKKVSTGQDDKWFCEECRIGGQIRTYRYLHRYAEAVEWEGLPPVASFGMTADGLEVYIAYGRLFVGFEGALLAYFSEESQVSAPSRFGVCISSVRVTWALF